LIEFALHSGLDVTIDALLPLSPEEQLRVVLDKAKKTGLFPEELGLDEFGRVFRNYAEVFQVNIRATRAYVPAPSPRRVVLYRARELAASVAYEPKYSWRDLTAEVEEHRLPGDHYTMLREPNVQVLADYLGASLRPFQAVNGEARTSYKD